MSEFLVYALHPFEPLNEDELAFKAGETILVLERDDQFDDGWWMGKNNRTGAVGLFPQSYTAEGPSGNPHAPFSIPSPSPPPQAGALSPLHEISEPSTPPSRPNAPFPSTTSDAASSKTDITGHERIPSLTLNGGGSPPTASMTDVQRAIESLGKRPGGANSIISRDDESFSFRSEASEDDADGDGGWHKHTRERLAENARRVVEEAKKLESMFEGGSPDPPRLAPPISLDMSDESDSEADDDDELDHRRDHTDEKEDEDVTHNSLSRSTKYHSAIIEESEGEHDDLNADDHGRISVGAFGSSEGLLVASPIAIKPEDIPIPPSMATSPAPSSPRPWATEIRKEIEAAKAASPAPNSRTMSPLPEKTVPTPPKAATPTPTPPPAPLPIIASSTTPLRSRSPLLPPPPVPVAEPPIISAPVPPHQPAPPTEPKEEEEEEVKDKPAEISTSHPSTWTLSQVIDWVRVKGFGEDVIDKFIEQEISGDVLLDLDAPTLKTEIGIMAFGKRVRIANAITELRMPPPVASPISATGQGVIEPLTPAQSHFSSSQHSARSLTIPSHNNVHERNNSMSVGSVGSYDDGYVAAIDDLDAGVVSRKGSGSGNGSGKTKDGKEGGAPHSMRRRLLFGRSVDSKEAYSDSASNRDSGNGTTVPESGPGLSPTQQTMIKDSHNMVDDGGKPIILQGPTLPSSPNPGTSTSSKHKKKTSISSSEEPGKKSRSTGVGLREKKKDGTSTSGKEGGRERLSLFGSFGSGNKDKDKDGGSGKGKRKEVPSMMGQAILSDPEASSHSGFTLGMLYTGRSASSTSRKNSEKEKEKEKEKEREKKEELHIPIMGERNTLRKRTSSHISPISPTTHGGAGAGAGAGTAVEKLALEVGEPDYKGWMRKKGERYNGWKLRYFVLKEQHLYILRSEDQKEAKIKSYINVQGYKVTVDENLNPGKYAFRLEHDTQRTHYFSSDDKVVVRGWMKAIMKATIGRDYSKPVISSVNIPTIPLVVAQAMNPGPRPPSPTQRDAMQRSFRRQNPNQLSSRDARVLMGLPGGGGGGGGNNDANENDPQRLDSFFSVGSADGESTIASTLGSAGLRTPTTISSGGMDTPTTAMTSILTPTPTKAAFSSPPPPRPTRRSSIRSVQTIIDPDLVDWANSHFPPSLQVSVPYFPESQPVTGLHLLRLAESIKGRPSSPPVPDSAFPIPNDPGDERLDGLFKLFDFLLDNDVKMGNVSINDIRTGRKDKIVQLLGALKDWERRRRILVESVGGGGVGVGGFVGVG